jgi:hypothetical protein
MINRKNFSVIAAAIMLLLAMYLSFNGGNSRVSAAPMALPTPITHNDEGSGAKNAFWFRAVPITADTRACLQFPNHEIADIQYTVDQTVVNTVTLKLQHSNDNVSFVDGTAIVAANAADANGLDQFLNYGRYSCIFADVATASTVTITVIGLMK